MTQLQQVFAGIYSLLHHIYYPLVFVVSLFLHKSVGVSMQVLHLTWNKNLRAT